MSTDTTDIVCEGWNANECEGTIHCPARCPRFVDKLGARWTIRPAVREDAGPLAEMYEGFGLSDRAQGLPPANHGRLTDWIDTMLTEGSNVVAERGGEVFGHAMYTPTDADRPELAVFVHPDMQGRGVGTELCRHVIADAAVADRETIELYVERSNRVARNVYRKVGFTLVDRQGDLRMELPLDDPAATEVQWPPFVREGPAEPATEEPTPVDIEEPSAVGADD